MGVELELERLDTLVGRPDVALEGVVGERHAFVDPVAWAARLRDLLRAVCQVRLHGQAIGTAFLVGPDLVLTSRHVVIATGRAVGTAELTFVFDHARPAEGGGTLEELPLTAVEEVASDDALDFALYRLQRTPDRDWITVPKSPSPTPGVAIIQHPLGASLKLALDLRMEAIHEDDVVRYDLDTDAGSSGSPVFSAQSWVLIALHRGVEKGPDGTIVQRQGVSIRAIALHAQVKPILDGLPPLPKRSLAILVEQRRRAEKLLADGQASQRGAGRDLVRTIVGGRGELSEPICGLIVRSCEPTVSVDERDASLRLAKVVGLATRVRSLVVAEWLTVNTPARLLEPISALFEDDPTSFSTVHDLLAQAAADDPTLVVHFQSAFVCITRQVNAGLGAEDRERAITLIARYQHLQDLRAELQTLHYAIRQTVLRFPDPPSETFLRFVVTRSGKRAAGFQVAKALHVEVSADVAGADLEVSTVPFLMPWRRRAIAVTLDRKGAIQMATLPSPGVLGSTRLRGRAGPHSERVVVIHPLPAVLFGVLLFVSAGYFGGLLAWVMAGRPELQIPTLVAAFGIPAAWGFSWWFPTRIFQGALRVPEVALGLSIAFATLAFLPSLVFVIATNRTGARIEHASLDFDLDPNDARTLDDSDRASLARLFCITEPTRASWSTSNWQGPFVRRSVVRAPQMWDVVVQEMQRHAKVTGWTHAHAGHDGAEVALESKSSCLPVDDATAHVQFKHGGLDLPYPWQVSGGSKDVLELGAPDQNAALVVTLAGHGPGAWTVDCASSGLTVFAELTHLAAGVTELVSRQDATVSTWKGSGPIWTCRPTIDSKPTYEIAGAPGFSLVIDSKGPFDVVVGTRTHACNVDGSTDVAAAWTITADGCQRYVAPEQDPTVVPERAVIIVFSDPPARTTDSKPTWRFTAPSAVRTVCRIDQNAFKPCTSSFGGTALAVGEHTGTVRALDAEGAAVATETRLVTIHRPELPLAFCKVKKVGNETTYVRLTEKSCGRGCYSEASLMTAAAERRRCSDVCKCGSR